MDDDFGHDADLIALTESTERTAAAAAAASRSATAPGGTSGGNSNSNSTSSTKVVQPTPRALPQRNTPSSIIVSTRQKGNPLLTHITALPWEYGDIAPDYIIGATACALFLSLKYHRLHPEYIYSRIRALGRSYQLRVLLVTVDIDNHEEPLRELAKTSLVNDFTLILAWSAREAARYLESYKTLEHAAPSAIRGARPSTYVEQLVEFVTTPRGINKTDALALVSTFGSLREACNAPVEALAGLQGWGEVKVNRWHRTVREPFRTAQAKERRGGAASNQRDVDDGYVPASRVGPVERQADMARREARREEERAHRDAQRADEEEQEAAEAAVAAARRADAEQQRKQGQSDVNNEPGDDEEEAMRQATASTTSASNKRTRAIEPELDAGIAVALAKYRKS